MKVKKIDIGIKGLGQSLQEFAEAWRKIESDERVRKDEAVYFETVDAMRAVLTNKRLLVLRTIRERRPHSVYELAKILGRDLKNVNQDLRLLAEIGLVTLEKTSTDKRRVIPHVDYSMIQVEIPV